MRLAWLTEQLRPRKRAGRRGSADPLKVRKLERRRVLAASVTDIFFAPVDLDAGTAAHDSNEGTQITATASASGQGQLLYQWTLKEGANVVQQSFNTSFVFTPIDEGNFTVTLTVTDAFQSSASRMEDVVVHNVAPSLTNVTNSTVSEGGTATVMANITDPGASDTFELDVDWKDGDPIDTITGLGAANAAGTVGNTQYQWTAATRQLILQHKYLDDNPTNTTFDKYSVNLVARDGDGGTSPKATSTVTVHNLPPHIFAPDQTASEGHELDLSAIMAPPLAVYVDVGVEDTFTATIDWGDGTVEAATVFSGPGGGAVGGKHTYLDDGVYMAKVTIMDDDGGMGMSTFQVTVANLPPVVQAAPDQAVDEGEELDLSAIMAPPLAVYADDGINDTHTATVDWGDGTVEPATVFAGMGGNGALGGKHTYADDGVYTVTVTVTDDDGAMDTDSFFVTVGNVDPMITSVDASLPPVFEGAVFSVTAKFSDPGYDNPNNPNPAVAPNILDPKNETFTYDIDWGDGTTGVVGATVVDVNGMPGTPSTGMFSGMHTYADDGVYTVTLRIHDDNGGVGETTVMVTVGNVAPTVTVPNGNQSVQEGSTLTLADLATFTDPGFDNPLNPNPAMLPDIADPTNEKFTYDVDWGDGRDAVTGATVADVNTPGVGSSGTISGSHIYADDGIYTVTVTVYDDNGGKQTKTFEVTVDNVDPELEVTPSGMMVDEGGTISFDAMFNDPGFDNPNNNNPTGAPAVGDPKNESFTYDVDWGDGRDAVTGMTVADMGGGPGSDSTGMFSGMHTYADDGTYTVTVTIRDDNGGTDTQTFTVVVNNVDPELTVTPSATTVDEGGTISFDAIFNDPGFDNPNNNNPTLPPAVGDPKAESFTYDIDWGDGRDAVTGVAVSDSGGAPGSDSTGMFSGMHTYADDGTYTVTITIHDDNGGVDTKTFTVVVDNVDPELTVTPSATTVDEGGTISFDAVFNDPGFDNPNNNNPTLPPAVGDPKAESFTYDINWGDGRDAVTGVSVTDMGGAPGSNSTGMFGGSHVYADDGTYTVTITIHDDNGGVDTKTFTVVVDNVNPVLTVTPSAMMIDEGGTISFDAVFNDPGFDNPNNNNPTLPPAVGDPKAESFTYDINWGDGRDTVTGVSVADMGGAPGSDSTGMFGGSHVYADDGTYTVTITIHDDNGGIDTKTFTVTVENVNPTLGVTPSAPMIDEGGSVSFDGTFSDPGSDNPNNPNAAVPPGITDPLNESFKYFVDWGDGREQVGSAALVDADSGPGTQSTGTFGGTHTYADDGTYTVTVRIADDNMSGNFASGVNGVDYVEKTFDIVVKNVQPTLTLTPGAASVNEGSSVGFDANFSDPGFDNSNNTNPTLPPAIGNPLAESFHYFIDWGDGRDQVPDQNVADTNGSVGVSSTGTFGGTHTYADNGTYTVKVRIADDNMTGNFAGGVAGVDFVEKTFTIVVNNVDPTLTGTTGIAINEGQQVTLGGLGVGITDPGFDNALNTGDPANGGETAETFDVMRVDWGDGTVDDNTDGDASDPITIVNRVSGGVGVNTTAGFNHSPHAYADNGTYTIKVMIKDDDGGFVEREFTITVNNVAPSLTLTNQAFTINEGQTLNIPAMGTFSDPGFDNPLNPNAVGGSVERFTYSINWGDGTPTETGELPATLVNGAQGVLTTGTLANSHFYADNDADNKYTITVTLTDDDGGTVERSFEITVLNVNPSLDPIIATDIDANTGTTTLTLTFADPGADSFQIMVDWGDKLGEPNPADRFVVETLYAGSTPQTFVIVHTYAGPPDPDHPTADITISVKIRDDDFQTLGVVQPGESNVQTVAISNPGINTNMVAIDTTPDVPRLDLTVPPTTPVFITDQAAATQLLQRLDVRGAGGELSATTERYLELRLVFPDGSESQGFRIKDEALLDLRAFFKTLPDGRYRIYLIRSETKTPRLVIEVDVRRGRVIDVSDDSEGTRDRPPTGEAETDAVPLEQNPLLEAAPEGTSQNETPAPTNAAAQSDIDSEASSASTSAALGAAAFALPWSERLERAFAEADDNTARRLRRAGRFGRTRRPLPLVRR